MINYNDYLRLEVEVPTTGLPNLVQNPSGVKGAWGYVTPVDNTSLSVYDPGATGGFRFITVAAPSYFTTELLSVAPGRYVGARFDLIFIDSGANVKVRFEWYNSAKTLISTSAQSGAISSVGTQYVSASLAPAGTAYVKAVFQVYRGTTGNPFGADQFIFNNLMVTHVASLNGFQTSRTNLIANPSFEVDATGWTRSPTTSGTVSNAVGGFSGSNSFRIVRSAAGAPSLGALVNAPVTAGQYLSLSFYARAATTGRTMYADVRFINGVGQVFGTASSYTGPADAVGTWTRKQLSMTVPAGAITANIAIGVDNVPGAEIHYIDAVMLEQGTEATPYFDGSTTNAGSTTYSWSGTAHNSASNALTTSYALAQPYAYMNILNPTSNISISGEEMNAGLFQATVYDPALDPSVTTNIRPGKRVRVLAYKASTAKWESLYEGRLTNARVTYDRANDAKPVKIALSATNNISLLANQAENRVLADIDGLPATLEGKGVPWNVNGSGDQVANPSVVAYNANASMLDQIAITRDTDLAYSWVDRNNVLQVHDSLASFPVVTRFTDKSTLVNGKDNVYYSAIDATFDMSEVINSVNIKYLRYNAGSGATQEVPYGPYEDGASIREYGALSKDFTICLPSEIPANIAAYAQTILTANSTPVRKVNSITVPIKNAGNVEAAIAVDLYSRVGIDLTNDGAVLFNNTTHVVTGKTHNITPELWTVTYTFASTGSVAAPTLTPSPSIGSAALGDTGWITPAMQDGWIQYPGWEPVGYRRLNGIVYLRGLIQSGNPNGGVFFTLPAGFRPSGSTHSPIAAASNLPARINVHTDGRVTPNYGASNVWTSLANVSFTADQ